MSRYRTHTCGQLRSEQVGTEVKLAGWVHRKRDHGNLLFIDLRDHYGITQIVAESGSEAFKQMEGLRSEYVISAVGKVVARTGDTINPNLPTGSVEVVVTTIEVLGEAADLPMPVFGEQEYPEDIRLKYRFLDLRRERLHNNIILRSKVISSIRRRMTDQGFMEFQTPILTASSPEGARDFLVPSRLHPGKFYALPQAPQQFKQLIMVSGFDRYFQIAPCFRDEDARKDRSPGEFYQLDVEMSFVEQDDVFNAVGPVIHGVFQEFANGRDCGPAEFPRIPYRESMLKYGSDKPDLRNPIILADVTEVFRGSGFGVFARNIENGAVVRGIPAPGAATRPRSFFDKTNDWARQEGAAGLGYIIFDNGEAKGPIAKFLDADRVALLKKLGNVQDGDAIFFACDKELPAAKLAGQARIRIGDELDICEKNVFKFCWIVDFPMFEYNEDDKKVDFSHNPFSMPQGGLEALNTQDPLTINAYQYDIVCNGVELSSGAIRNHKPEIMYKAFEIAGYGPEVVEDKFGGMLNAFKFGAPPHGGIAPGIDRIVMLLADEPNIREIVLFPMNQQAQDLMMQAPSEATMKQLRELHIRVHAPELDKKSS
ncbi:aspartate--tRNA ligase [Ferrovibrio terrae]|uniref:Aspartate--tRNA(Asp/Asn) ligase n=1 Tax=Ferrovibrio terrae TaxID=2594003 RepID=A0A516H6E9_9PROT|nr:aspartate--tRNA ligase [Ferrovibrio terrae]QDO99270.1 aspartate--tRNA ligase [Ferrovibrio terrae]